MSNTAKSEQIYARLDPAGKHRFEKACARIDRKPSEVLRNLAQQFSVGSVKYTTPRQLCP
jgi:hypothetical protein